MIQKKKKARGGQSGAEVKESVCVCVCAHTHTCVCVCVCTCVCVSALKDTEPNLLNCPFSNALW